MKQQKLSKWQLLYSGFFACFLFFSSWINHCWAGVRNPFIDTVLVYHVGAITENDIASLAKYDAIDLNRFTFDDVNGATYAAVKAINPAIEIYAYQMGTNTRDDRDSWDALWLNVIARYNDAKYHSMGSINGNHPGFFLLNQSSVRINDGGDAHAWLMDFGLADYQAYWMEAAATDIINRAWKADGIFLDGVTAANAWGTEQGSWALKYPNAATWNSALNNFANGITGRLHSANQKSYMNRGIARDQAVYDAYMALDSQATPPDIVMQEGAFAVLWGYPNGVQFYPENEWVMQANSIKNLQHSKVALLSHTALTASNPNGTDNYGKPVNYWQILWYSMCSYHLARHDAPNNSYFMFGSGDPYGELAWFDEYDRINLGAAVGTYTHPQAGIYFREFTKGWIYVNPTANDVPSVILPAPGKQLTHANINTDTAALPIVTAVSVPSHNGVIVMKAVASPLVQAPYGGTAWPVPGTIWPYDYDTGGEGIAYHDTTAGPQGNSAYRHDDVDIWGNPPDANTAIECTTGEWLEYTINVANSGSYDFSLKAGTPLDSRTAHIEIDGNDVSGPINIPNTGSYENQQEARATVVLTAGTHILRLATDSGYFNAYKISLAAFGSADAPAAPTGLNVQ